MFLGVSSGIALAAVCAFLAAKPEGIAAYVRDKYSRGPRWVRNWPFAGMVTKEWYPTYLPVVGLGGFVCALVWVSMWVSPIVKEYSK